MGGPICVVVSPAFPATGRMVCQGHIFVLDRLLSENGMQSHPPTPMTDPDPRRWRAPQTAGAIGPVPRDRVHLGGHSGKAC